MVASSEILTILAQTAPGVLAVVVFMLILFPFLWRIFSRLTEELSKVLWTIVEEIRHSTEAQVQLVDKVQSARDEHRIILETFRPLFLEWLRVHPLAEDLPAGTQSPPIPEKKP